MAFSVGVPPGDGPPGWPLAALHFLCKTRPRKEVLHAHTQGCAPVSVSSTGDLGRRSFCWNVEIEPFQITLNDWHTAERADGSAPSLVRLGGSRPLNLEITKIQRSHSHPLTAARFRIT